MTRTADTRTPFITPMQALFLTLVLAGIAVSVGGLFALPAEGTDLVS